MDAILPVISKVAVMLILIAVGCAVTKLRMLSEKGAAEITTLLIKIVTPCLIVNSLLKAGDELDVSQLLLAMGLSAAAILIALGLSYCFFHKEPLDRKKVLRFAATYSNGGFMGLPLIQAIVGDQGVVYGSFFVVMFNVICWTHGYRMMTGGKLNLKAALLNPGIIGLAVGLPVYFLKLQVPAVIAEPIGFLSSLNTPLAMLIIGSYVARVKVKDFLSDPAVYKMCLARLILAPGIFLLLLMVLKPGPVPFVSFMIQAAAPVAANCVLFAVEYGGDSKLASKAVAASTVLSIITIPVFTILAQMAAAR